MPLDQAAMCISRSQLSCGAALGIDPETARHQSEKKTTGPRGQVCHFTRWPVAGGRSPEPSWRAAQPCEWFRGVARNRPQCAWGLDAVHRNQLRRFAPADAWATPGIEPGSSRTLSTPKPPATKARNIPPGQAAKFVTSRGGRWPEGAAPHHPGAQLSHVSGSGEWRGTACSVCGG